MALISKIRKNSWLLVALIALGLIGFIVMDMTSGQQSVFGSSQTTIGEFGGEKLDWNKFNRVEQLLYGSSGGDVYARRNQLWNYFVEEAIVKEEAEDLGLGVSLTELKDLQFGTEPSPIIRQRFTDPNTRQIDFQQLQQIKNAIEDGTINDDPRMVAYWAHQEQEIIKDRLQSKLSNLVTKAIYTPTWMAEMGHSELNMPVTFAYVKVPFDEVDNADVTLSDEDYKTFLKENRSTYEQNEETRKLEYVVFDVLPTAADSTQLRQRIAELIPEFEQAENDSNFVDRNYGSINGNFMPKTSLSPAIADTVFNIPVGSVYGPYTEGRAYKAVKVIDRRMIADSADTRHILISADSPQAFAAAKSKLDSLENLILNGGETFDSLAMKFSQDPGSADKGGVYENVTPGQFVPEYNTILFETGQIGQLYKVRTSFGWHLVEVLSRSSSGTERVKVAYLQESIIPSETTQEDIYAAVLDFVGKNRDIEELRTAAAENADLELETSISLKRNDFSVGTLGGGQASRDMIRWAYNANVGEVSPEIYSYQDPQEYFTNKMVVAALRSKQSSGMPSVANIKDEIEDQVINVKKGEKLKSEISSTDLAALANKYSTKIDTANNVNFSASFVPTLGVEPKVIGEAFNLAEGSTSQPIIGKTGVFVVKVLSKTPASQATNIPQLRRNMATPVRNQVPRNLMEAMKDNANIEDNRFRFY
ncbi:MAG: peptidylprolyl isomerase [Chitinophagales bacterium]|nr:peptidylprolyl isomerase [Chitinophagales bacterium]